MIVPLNAGQNTIEMFNVTDHAVPRLDTMVITPSANALCSAPPSRPDNLTASAATKGVILQWTSSNWPADCANRFYNVYRSASSDFIPSSKNRIGGGIHASYADMTALCGITHTIWFRPLTPRVPQPLCKQAE